MFGGWGGTLGIAIWSVISSMGMGSLFVKRAVRMMVFWDRVGERVIVKLVDEGVSVTVDEGWGSWTAELNVPKSSSMAVVEEEGVCRVMVEGAVVGGLYIGGEEYGLEVCEGIEGV
jgi:hypothetical protein